MRSRVCDECGSGNILSDAEYGELVCMECGYVITECYVDLGQEWRAFDQEQKVKRSRVGAPMTWAIRARENVRRIHPTLHPPPGDEGSHLPHLKGIEETGHPK